MPVTVASSVRDVLSDEDASTVNVCDAVGVGVGGGVSVLVTSSDSERELDSDTTSDTDAVLLKPFVMDSVHEIRLVSDLDSSSENVAVGLGVGPGVIVGAGVTVFERVASMDSESE